MTRDFNASSKLTVLVVPSCLLTTSYAVAPSYPILHFTLLPSYPTSNPVLPYPTPSNHLPPRSRLASPAILPCPTLSYPILPHPTPSYTVFYCPPNLVLHWILLRFYPVLPYPTTANHILPCLTFVYPSLRCVLLPSCTGFYPILPYPTLYPSAILPHIQPSPNPSYPI